VWLKKGEWLMDALVGASPALLVEANAYIINVNNCQGRAFCTWLNKDLLSSLRIETSMSWKVTR
jgi:hypothetical protein